MKIPTDWCKKERIEDGLGRKKNLKEPQNSSKTKDTMKTSSIKINI
jgi:hypothetical protein